MTPIEQKLWDAARCDGDVLTSLTVGAPTPDAVRATALTKHGSSLPSVVIGFQVPFHRYRVDFVVSEMVGGREFIVLVECDGHEFHERTKEQASRDRSRDRCFQKIHPVYRFTGSEIWNNPRDCWDEVREVLAWQEDAHTQTERRIYRNVASNFVASNVSDASVPLVWDAFYFPGNPLTWDDIRRRGLTEEGFAASIRELAPYVSCSIDVRGRYVLRPSKQMRSMYFDN